MGKKLKIIYFLFSILIAIVLINTIFFIRSKNKITFTEKYCDCFKLSSKYLKNSQLYTWTIIILIKISDKVDDYRPICFGTILNQKTILTSATCFKSLSQKNLSNLFVTSDLDQIENYRKIVKIYFHPKFKSSNEFRSFHDLALVELNKNFEFIDNQSEIRPACLIDKKFDHFNKNYFSIANFGNKKLLPFKSNETKFTDNLNDYKLTITNVKKINCSNSLDKLVEQKLINSSFVDQFESCSICLKNSKNLNSIDNIGTIVPYKYDLKYFIIGIINNYLIEQLRDDDNYLNNSVGFFTLFDEQHFNWIQKVIGHNNMCTDLDKTNREEFNHFILVTGVSYFLVSCLILFILTAYLPPKKNSIDKDGNYLSSDLKNLDDSSKNLNTDNGKFNLSGKSLTKSKKSKIKNSISNNIEMKILTKNDKIDKIDEKVYDKIIKQVNDNKNIESKESKIGTKEKEEELKNDMNKLLNDDISSKTELIEDQTNNNEINNNQQFNEDKSIDNRIKKVKFNE